MVGSLRLSDPSEQSFQRLQRNLHQTLEENQTLEEVERLDQPDLVDLFDRGPRPMAELDRQGRETALKLAIAAFPAGPETHVLSAQAWFSLLEVARVIDKGQTESVSVSLNGLTCPIEYSPPPERPGMVESYRQFLELRELAARGGAGKPGSRPELEGRQALELEQRHYHEHNDRFRLILGLTGEPTLAAWGAHRLEEEKAGEKALERLAGLRPGLENGELFHLIPLACRAGDAVWEKAATSGDYETALRRLAAIQSLGGQLDPLWDQLGRFEERMGQLGLSAQQVDGLIQWAADHTEPLQRVLPGDDLFASLAEVLENPWRDQAQQNPDYLEGMLMARLEGQDWEACAGEVDQVYWLHGSVQAQKEHQARLEEAWKTGRLPQESLEEAGREFDFRLRMERLLGTDHEPAATAALAALQARQKSLLEVELTPESLTIGGVSIAVEEF